MTSPLLLLFEDPARAIAIVVSFALAVALHELSHALAATSQGDPTPRQAGRLTPNPLAHLDRFGLIIFVVAGIGWGSTPVDPSRFRSRRLGQALVAGVGPLSNLALALLCAVSLRVFAGEMRANERLFTFVVTFFSMNVFLAVLNLLPIPPLDGSRILVAVLPRRYAGVAEFLDQYGIYLLLALFLLPALNPSLNWIGPLISTVQLWVLGLVGLG